MADDEHDLDGLRFDWDGQEAMLTGPPNALRRLSPNCATSTTRRYL